MLKILVNNQVIYITKDTSIQMEVNNSIFSIDEIPGEIIYTFDVPAQPNDKIFNYSRFVYVQKTKKFEAEILIGGIQIAKGDLYIQKATKTAYSLGLVVNSFPVGWADKKLNESDYGEIVISKNSTEHKAKWLEFLKNSLKPDSDIKFPLFIDENFYGGKNEDFGFINGKQAFIQNYFLINETDVLENFFVNRLFTKNGKDVLETNITPGITVFNKFSPEVPENSFTFAPAVNLFFFIKLFLKKLNINVFGNFFNNENFKKTYYQSLRALDNIEENVLNLGVKFQTQNADDLVEHNSESLPYEELWHNAIEYEDKKIHYFKPSRSSTPYIEIEVNFIIPDNFFVKYNPYQIEDPILLLYIIEEIGKNPQFIKNVDTAPRLGFKYNSNSGISDFAYIFVEAFTKQKMNDQFGYKGKKMLCKYKIKIFPNLQKTRNYRFHIGKFFQLSKESGYTNIYYGGYHEKTYNSVIFPNINTNFYNTFSSILNISEHTPNLSNGEFIKNIKNIFGLAINYDTQSKQIELLQIKDIFSAGYLQLDKYLLNNESYISESENNRFSYKLPPVNDEEIDTSRLISEVEKIKDLGLAKNNLGKIAFIKNQNKYVESIKVGDPEKNWDYIYKKFSGNNKEIYSGEGDIQEITPAVLIPNMKDIDSNIGATDVILEIDKTGVSQLFSTGTTEFDMILINYGGLKNISLNPTVFYESAEIISQNLSKYDLCVTGENSIGEIFIKPWITLLANHETITHKFLFDLKTFLEVWQLLKPQNKPVEQQTRWVMVGSVKLLPKKITFQFTEGKEYILAEIEFAKPIVEI